MLPMDAFYPELQQVLKPESTSIEAYYEKHN